jgi:ribosomal protein S18 acetylase RimI-like enzyme
MQLTCNPVLHDTDCLDPSVFFKGVFEADPHFFNLFDPECAGKLLIAMDQLHMDSSSDFYRPLVARNDQNVLGFLYAYPYKEMFSRQATSLRQFINCSDNPRALRPSLAALSSSKGRIVNLNSYYLARIYVLPIARGFKVGEFLMRNYERNAVALGMSSLSLHVRSENTRAQNFYARLGFKFSDGLTHGYLSMEKCL